MYVHFYLVPILKRIQPCKVPLNKKSFAILRNWTKLVEILNIFFIAYRVSPTTIQS